MRKKIILLLTLAFALSLIFSFSLSASANAIDKTDANTDVATIEQVTTLSDNEYSTLDEFTSAFAQAIYNRQERTVLRLRGAELSNADIAKSTYEILKHDPDNPKGGDYITYHMPGGYNYNFVVKEDENGVYTELVFECAYSADAQMEKEVDEAVEALLAELNLWEASDYRKIRGVYDWMADNITYDYDWDDGVLDDEHEHSVHAAIIDRVAVCDGISNLFYRLMLELDVDCRIITGGEADERHAWNIVKLNGVYYNVDATWDLGVSDYHRYFLCTESNFIGHDKDSFFESEEWLAKYPMATLPYVEHVAASGSVNANIHWVLDADTGTLTVSGRGAIPSYRYSYAPWYSYRNNIARIVIEEGITEVGERSFYWSVNCSEVILPSSLIAIRQYGFNNLQSLEGITLPENLKIIEFCAFSECTALKSIVLPDSVTTVGSSAFSNCKVLTSAVLSAGMKEVPDSMFFGDVKLASVVLPEGITCIDDTVFSNCAFTEFTIPSTVTSIGVSAFSSCSKLTSITVDEKNTTYKSVDGVLFSKDGTHLICYPAAKKGAQYAIPEGTVVIDYGAFRGQSKLFTVSFPSTLVEIEGYAFSYCPYLDSLVFPKKLITIGSDAFRSCRYLSSVTFENPDVNLVGYTFADCTSLQKIDLPANLKEIPNGLFFGCIGLENIDIPKTVTSIGSSSFFDCDSLIDVVIPGNVKTIGQQAFDFCKFLDSITFEEGVTTLDWIAIRNAPSLSTVVFPSSLKSIGTENFENCPYVRIYADCGSVGYNYAINNGIRYTASHNYVPIASYPSTCTKQGYTLYSCPCGKSGSYKDDYLPLLPHTYKAKVTAPTCTDQGYTTHTCTACGDSCVSNYVDATGHTYENGVCIGCGQLNDYDGHLQQLPESLCGGMNLWPMLRHDSDYYYAGTHWGKLNDVHSVTIPIKPGDKLVATSFAKGIRVAYFDNSGLLISVPSEQVKSEFSANGFLLVPDGAVAVNIPMWDNSATNELYISSRSHSFEEDRCSICQYQRMQVTVKDMAQTVGAVYASDGTYNASYTNNWFADIPIPNGAEQIRVLTFKTGAGCGSVFFGAGKYISGYADTEIGGQWITLDIPVGADTFRYCYLTDTVAQQNDVPLFEYVEFLGKKMGPLEKPPFAYRPSTGCHSFSVEVNIAPAQGNPEGYITGTDYGYIQLPTNYNPYGEPTRLIIVCHGAGASLTTYQSDEWKDTNHSFWTDLGYAVMDMYACPTELTGSNSALHYGNPIVLDCYKAGYDYVMKNFNLKQDGIYVIGSSMGGLSSFQIVQSGQFPVLAQVAYCPVIDLFKQAYCNPWTTASYQRSRISSYFGFTGTLPVFTNGKFPSSEEIAFYKQNLDKTIAYSPILHNLVAGDVSTIFDVVPTSATATNDAEAAIYGQFTATHPCPLIIFHNTDDSTVSYRYSQYFVDMLKQSGQNATLYTFTSGGHNAWANGQNFALEGINGDITIKESQYEAYLFFSKLENHKEHYPWIDPAVAPTCTETGLTEGSHCAFCGEVLKAQETVAALTHTYTSVATPPTCTEQGYTTHTCSSCGASYIDTYTDAIGHIFKNGVCIVCGVEHPNLANYEGKVISILGDSSSTFAGYIPEADGFNLAHRARYPQSNLLTDVDETWWMQLITALDAKLGVNESWAGSQVLNTSDVNSGDLGPDAAMASLTRIQNLGSNGTPDIILFYGAGNDIGRAVTLGEFNPDSAPKTLNLYATKWNTFADAYVEAILRLKHFYPNSYIVVILYQYIPGYFTNEELDTYNSIIKSICDHYNIPTIDLRNSGITPSMLPDNVHPNADGMDLITQTVLDELITNFTIEFGENVVYSITHELNNATASKHYYKNVSALSEFSETITGENVIITMGGIDITSSCYSNGTIVIPKVTGDIIIKAKSTFNADGHLQQLSDSICSNTNLWTTLEPENIYYTANGWGLFSNSPNVHSVTFSVAFGDKIWATSFGAAGANGDTINGTRITWFDENGVTKSISRDKVYAEFSKQGYITVPKGAIAINIPMIDNNESFEIYILNRDHNYKNGICAGCGEKEPHIHFYKFTVTHPTCTEQGYTTYICECGDSYVDNYVDARDHNYGEWYEVTAPTCTEDGLERRNCIRCDAFETNVISKLGHSYGSVTTAPTCTVQGYTTYTCHCGDSYVDNYVNALGHTHSEVVVENGVDPTCTTSGSCDNVIYCTECREEISREKVTSDALGHSYGNWYEVTTPTCTADGLERRDCARCDAFETNIISKLGHSYSYVITAPTCTERGYTTYTCHCGDSYVDNYIDALGHTLGEVVVENVVEPTCVASGSCENVIYCTKCGAELSRSKMTVDPLGHTPGEAVAENIVAPTCTAEGSYDNVVYCKVCGVELDREVVVVEATGHNYKAWVQIVAPGCETGGVERRECINCKKYETRDIAALGHEWVEDEYHRVCTFCGEIVELEIDHSGCEASLFETIINAIINFFRILFGLPEICVCGEELN